MTASGGPFRESDHLAYASLQMVNEDIHASRLSGYLLAASGIKIRVSPGDRKGLVARFPDPAVFSRALTSGFAS